MTIIGTEPQISDEDFASAMEAIAAAQTVEEISLRHKNTAYYTAISYHHLPAIGSYDYDKKGRYWHDGLPEEIINYLDSFNGHPDPVMEYAMPRGNPLWISELPEIPEFSDNANVQRVNLALEYVCDGLVVPLYGPFLKQGYVFISFGKKREFFSDAFKWQIQSLLQSIHVKYCFLTNAFQDSIRLTKRQSEVLELITFGKTNPEIGQILGISPSTVAGYVKQIFLKLDVSDRVSAALRALSFDQN